VVDSTAAAPVAAVGPPVAYGWEEAVAPRPVAPEEKSSLSLPRPLSPPRTAVKCTKLLLAPVLLTGAIRLEAELRVVTMAIGMILLSSSICGGELGDREEWGRRRRAWGYTEGEGSLEAKAAARGRSPVILELLSPVVK